MGRHLPPFAAVRAFEAAARHLSFKAAADELCLSPSAISHQIKALETYLDTTLFERHGNLLELSLTGHGYAGKLTQLLNQLDVCTREVETRNEQTLRVLCTPGFAARWLVPRLNRFRHAALLRLRLSSGAPSVDFATNDSDIVIQWSTGPTPGVSLDPLMFSGRYPVVAPHVLQHTRLKQPEDLLDQTLIYDETDDAWPQWFAAAGLSNAVLPQGPVFPNCELATTLAEKGCGISLAYDAVVRGTLLSGRLVRLFDTVTTPMVIYALAYPEHCSHDTLLGEFRHWILAEAAREGDLPQVVSNRS